MVENWLITGGCGYIGTSLISSIVSLNPDANITVFDNLTVGTREDLAAVCSFTEVGISQYSGASEKQLVVGDIRDADSCLSVCKGVECIVHLAANTGVGPSVDDPRGDMEANVIGIFNMLEAARMNGVKSFIFASSGAPAGEVDPPIHEELAPHPVSPYGASKLAGEGYCSAYYKTFGIKTVSLRFGNVYGPRSKHKSSVVAKFIRQALLGELCEIYGNGTQTRDFIYIDDLVDAIIKASEFDGGGETFQIATSCERTVSEIAEIIRGELAKHGYEIRVNHAERRIGDVMRNFSDISKARNVLGWGPKKDIHEGIEETVKYFVHIAGEIS